MARRPPPSRRDPPAADRQRLLTLATAHHKAGRAAEAERLYRQILVHDPHHGPALMNLGVLRRAMGHPKEAATLYQRGLARDPGHPGFNLNLGNALLELEDWAGAERALRLALARTPQDIQIMTSLGRALLEMGRLDETITLCRAVIALQPRTTKARRNLYLALRRANRGDEAAAELRHLAELDPDDPAGRHLLAAAEGRTTAAAPTGYVRNLFDGFAAHFETQLRDKLDYRTPELLLALLGRHLPAGRRFAHALDLGCGTGLMGPLLRPLADRLEGVDLSPRMLREAQAKNLYDVLAEGEIVDHLGSMSARPDLAVAADVLVYIGDLDPLMRGLAGRLAPDGLVLISTEAGDTEDFRLLPSGRYAHRPAYVEATARAHGFVLLAAEAAVIRRDEGHPIMGGLYLLRLGEGSSLDALRQLGAMERRRGRIEAAADAWRQALEQVPDDPWLHRALGEALAQLHDFKGGADHFARAAELSPSDPGALHGLGAVLLQIGQGEKAFAALRRAIELAPREPSIHFELARALAISGAETEARQALEQARATGLDADSIGLLEHLIEGREGGAATIGALQRIYDRAAPHYESHVIVGLDNRTWRRLLELLDRQQGSAGRWESGLELGCGPGTAGTELRRRVARLTGVDLSPAMIEQAGRRDAYERLVAADLMAFLGDPGEAESYNLMFAADVLPHIGDFVTLLTRAADRLRPGGLFLFSTEHSDGEDRVPLPEFRFRHSLAYVENAAVTAGLTVAAHEVSQIRVERGAPVMGGLYLLRKPV